MKIEGLSHLGSKTEYKQDYAPRCWRRSITNTLIMIIG